MAKCLFCKFDNASAEFQKHRSHTTLSAIDRLFGACNEVFKAIQNKTEVPKMDVCGHHSEVGAIEHFLAGYWKLFDEVKKGVMLPAIRTR